MGMMKEGDKNEKSLKANGRQKMFLIWVNVKDFTQAPLYVFQLPSSSVSKLHLSQGNKVKEDTEEWILGYGKQ